MFYRIITSDNAYPVLKMEEVVEMVREAESQNKIWSVVVNDNDSTKDISWSVASRLFGYRGRKANFHARFHQHKRLSNGKNRVAGDIAPRCYSNA